MSMGEVARDGFTCASGRFCAYGMDRVEASDLKRMFFPKVTWEAQRLLRNHRDRFVPAQLKHYGVEYDQNELTGNGVDLLRKVLQAGLCDNVPDHIQKLKSEMHAEWLESRSIESIKGRPELIMEKCFLDQSGNPDTTKTNDMNEAAQNHVAKEAWEIQRQKDERKAERAARRAKYIGFQRYSIIGRYIINCKSIREGWPDMARRMTMAVRIADDESTNGIYEAVFDFGVFEGMMILSADKTALNEYCSLLESRNETRCDVDEDEESQFEDSHDEESQSEDSQDEESNAGTTRKATSGSGQPPENKRDSSANCREFFFYLKCSDPGIGEIGFILEKGKLKFGGFMLASFTGTMDLLCVGSEVTFTGYKMSALPPKFYASWEDYSEAEYERPRVGRWW
ncbi:hypothetical protein B0T22DRAFT_510245 [Podospora appendiculata]|uniref:Uncharacterized protein n=1 Tax=Podospora appendiculata TaxID=314037 RepID=A0AAE1CBG9_9PEZI|nr:hypothetical protein B0T22DRAFT_510245 [Podospora appendiculata]